MHLPLLLLIAPADAAPSPPLGLILGASALLVPLLLSLITLKLSYRTIRPDEALIIGRPGGTIVSYTGRLVLPIVHHAEVVSLAARPLVFEIGADDPLRFEDGSCATMRVHLDVGVFRNEKDVLRAAEIYGLETLADPARLHARLAPRITDAARSIATHFTDLRALRGRTTELADLLLAHMGMDLDGLTLDAPSVSKLEACPTPALR